MNGWDKTADWNKDRKLLMITCLLTASSLVFLDVKSTFQGLMGVTLERVQNKFACIIGELCSEPDILSEFAIWLDLRLAEYKAKGAISLECSGESPDPTWLRGYKGPPKRMKQGDMTPTLPTERLHHYDSISQYEQDLSQEAAERLSPEIMVVKEEPSDNSGVYPVSVHRHTTPNRNHSRKRSEPGAAGQSGDSPSPFKIQRLSEPATVLEPVNQSLMSIISESGLDDSGDVADMSSADFSNIDISTNRGDNSNVFSTQVIPSTSSRDSAEQQDGSNSAADITSDRCLAPSVQNSPTHNLQRQRFLAVKKNAAVKNVKSRIVNIESKSTTTIGNLVGAVSKLENWLITKKEEARKIEDIDPPDLDSYLSEFFSILKNRHGFDYDPESFSNFRSFLERFLKERGYPASLSSSSLFNKSQIVYNQKRRMLTKSAMERRQARHQQYYMRLKLAATMAQQLPRHVGDQSDRPKDLTNY